MLGGARAGGARAARDRLGLARPLARDRPRRRRELIEIAPGEFGHGRTRNLGAERASGELICFLTQDAVPVAGWLDAYREAFELAPDVGAAFGPHLPASRTRAR